MIASHDTYTFLRPLQWWARLCPWLWRTQTRDLSEQLDRGVRYLDIRIRRHERGWRVCHGLVDFPRTFSTLAEIPARFFPIPLRIILERGDSCLFEIEACRLASACQAGQHPNLHLLAVKNPWREIHRSATITDPDTGLRIPAPHVKDHTYIPWNTGLSLMQNLRRFHPSTIARWARSHPILPGEESDPHTLHFHDRI